MNSLLYIILAIIIISYGGNRLVIYASALANKLNISSMFIGIVVIGVGTSLPEIFVASSAIKNASPDIALGTIIGSNISNILLVLGLALLLFKKNIFKNKTGRNIDLVFMLVVTIFLSVILEFYGSISFLIAIFMVLLVPVYFYVSFKFSIIDEEDQTLIEEDQFYKILINLLIGFFCLYIGSEIFIYGLKDFSFYFGIPEAIVGLSIAAIGTSLPEIAVTISSAINNQERMLIGNIIGSNIINILGALGVASILNNSILVPKDSSDIHLYLLCISAFWLFFLAKKINIQLVTQRIFGFLSLLVYFAYIFILYGFH